MLIGIIIGVLLSLVVFLLYDKFKPKTSLQSLTEEEERKNKEMQEHYNNMLNYDATKAYGGTHG